MIQEYIDELLDSEETRGLTDSTRKDLRRLLGKFSDYCRQKGADAAESLTPQFIADYMLTEHAGKKFDNKKSYVWALRKLGHYLQFTGLLSDNIASALRHPRKPSRGPLADYLSLDEMRKLLTWCHEIGSKRDFAIVSLMCTNGLRPVDVAGVKRSQYNSQGCYFDGLVKGQWIKRTPLSDATVTVIDNYLETRTDDCDSLFINKQNKPMTTDRIRDAVKQCGQYAGLERVTPRLLRHTFATHFTDRHGTILCAAVMGHASTKSTKVYAHLSPRHFRPLMNRHPFIFGALKK